MIEIYFDENDKEYQDIMLCLNHLYQTTAGTCPLDRDFGINYEDIIGAPSEIAKNNLSYEIITKTEKYESRVSVKEIKFDTPLEDGQLRPIIYVSREEDEDDDE